MKNNLLLFLGILIIAVEISGQEKSFRPDTSINGICLHDTTSLITVIPDISKYINHAGPGAQASFLNKKGTEIMTLIFHSGSNANEVAEMKVESFNNQNEIPPTINEIETFKTNNGIALIINKQTLVSLIGNDFKNEKINETEFLIYKINDIKTSGFLCQYNMPEYYAKYTFKHNKLTEFKFGFTYP
ncbi:MAG: hypothetical protein K9H64_14325 [Bacteroidales bacterium]|nr:hypothetical protein [Bacteroidales bacterium]MCF8457143.1 hypothetical protein [Bacteroidales bacterium]